MAKVFIIAEAGVNHNGSAKTAKLLIDIAADSKADAVKFQTFNAEAVISRWAPKAEYQKQTTGAGESQLDMARQLQLSQSEHYELVEHCRKRQILFLSTPFDMKSVDFLKRIGVGIFKIPSGEITNLPYLRKIAKMNKK